MGDDGSQALVADADQVGELVLEEEVASTHDAFESIQVKPRHLVSGWLLTSVSAAPAIPGSPPRNLPNWMAAVIGWLLSWVAAVSTQSGPSLDRRRGIALYPSQS
jgi:hypothetical protein